MELVNQTFGVDRTLRWFEHQHVANPAGRSILWVAVNESGRVVSYRSLIMMAARYEGRLIKSAQLADAATKPEYRGKGLFGHLNEMAFAEFSASGGELLFGFPAGRMSMSLPIYVSRFGFTDLGRIRHCVFPVSARALPLGESAIRLYSALFPSSSAVVQILAARDALGNVSFRDIEKERVLAFPRDQEIVRWRVSMPGRTYRFAVMDEENFLVLGDAVRHGWTTCTVLDGRHTSPRNLKLLLRGVISWAREAGYDLIYAWSHAPLPYLRCGFLPTLRGTALVAKLMGETKHADILSSIRRWQVTLLDTDAY